MVFSFYTGTLAAYVRCNTLYYMYQFHFQRDYITMTYFISGRNGFSKKIPNGRSSRKRENRAPGMNNDVSSLIREWLWKAHNISLLYCPEQMYSTALVHNDDNNSGETADNAHTRCVKPIKSGSKKPAIKSQTTFIYGLHATGLLF